MYCKECGHENPEGAKFCVCCGASLNADSQSSRTDTTAPAYSYAEYQPQSDMSGSPAAMRVLGALRDKLYLAFCILLSCGVGLGIFSGSFDIVRILLLIFCWLAYSAARKGRAEDRYLRDISGTVFAGFVLRLVLGGLLILIGIFYWVFVAALGNAGYDLGALINQAISSIGLKSVFGGLLGGYLGIIAAWLHIFLIVLAVVYILAAILLIRPVHRFLKSVYEGVQSGREDFVDPHKARICLMVLGILNAVSALSSFSISAGCIAASMIVASVLIRNHFDRQF